MIDPITLDAADGHAFSAYVARPIEKPKGAVVVLQEIFGVNSHIQSVADRYASAGYLAVAPAMFDRVQTGVSLGYTGPDMDEGRRLKAEAEALPAPGVLADVQAAVNYAASQSGGKVGVVGYCWGGLLVWRSAAEVEGVAAAVAYYGGGMTAGNEPSRQPRCPTMAHFGAHDAHIPLDGVHAFAHQHPEVEVHIYQADHGFNCDARGSYDATAAKQASERTLAFFKQHLG